MEAFTVPLYHTEETFANEEEVGGGEEEEEDLDRAKGQPWRPRTAARCGPETNGGSSSSGGTTTNPRLVYSLAAADGSFQSSGSDITVLWQKEWEASHNHHSSG